MLLVTICLMLIDISYIYLMIGMKLETLIFCSTNIPSFT